MATLVLWFRNDLRLHDNAVLAFALAKLRAGTARHVLPVYFLDERDFAPTKLGFPKTGLLRAKFLLESITDFKNSLKSLGSDLLVAVGRPETIIPELVAPFAKDALVVFQKEVTSEETAIEASVKAACAGKAALEAIWGATMIHLDDLPVPVRSIPDGFTAFRAKVEASAQPRALLPSPSKGQLPLPPRASLGAHSLAFEPAWQHIPYHGAQPEPVTDPRGVLPFKGGEQAALERLNYYVHGKQRLVADYFNTRNGLLGGDYSTKFAPWLALGCLSPRMVYHEIKRFEATTGVENKSTYWVVFEMLWRDYFRFFAMKHGNRIFLAGGPMASTKRWPRDRALFRRWADGLTGAPFVDACMRELNATGFMSNRGRQNVASYLVHDLGLDWRMGAAYFESLLLDYDVCSNWGNWVAAAGLTGGRINRFNVYKQAAEYDTNGDFVRAWVPELGRIPAPLIHSPHRLSAAQQQQYQCKMGDQYPLPVASSAEIASTSAAGAGPQGAAARWSQPRYQRPAKTFAPKSDFERFG